MSVYLQPTATRESLDATIGRYQRLPANGFKSFFGALGIHGRCAVIAVEGLAETVWNVAKTALALVTATFRIRCLYSPGTYFGLARGALKGSALASLGVLSVARVVNITTRYNVDAAKRADEVRQQAFKSLAACRDAYLDKHRAKMLQDTEYGDLLLPKVEAVYQRCVDNVEGYYKDGVLKISDAYRGLPWLQKKCEDVAKTAPAAFDAVAVDAKEVNSRYHKLALDEVESVFATLKNETFSWDNVSYVYGPSLDKDTMMNAVATALEKQRKEYAVVVDALLVAEDPCKAYHELLEKLKNVEGDLDKDMAEAAETARKVFLLPLAKKAFEQAIQEPIMATVSLETLQEPYRQNSDIVGFYQTFSTAYAKGQKTLQEELDRLPKAYDVEEAYDVFRGHLTDFVKDYSKTAKVIGLAYDATIRLDKNLSQLFLGERHLQEVQEKHKNHVDLSVVRQHLGCAVVPREEALRHEISTFLKSFNAEDTYQEFLKHLCDSIDEIKKEEEKAINIGERSYFTRLAGEDCKKAFQELLQGDISYQAIEEKYQGHLDMSLVRSKLDGAIQAKIDLLNNHVAALSSSAAVEESYQNFQQQQLPNAILELREVAESAIEEARKPYYIATVTSKTKEINLSLQQALRERATLLEPDETKPLPQVLRDIRNDFSRELCRQNDAFMKGPKDEKAFQEVCEALKYLHADATKKILRAGRGWWPF